MKCEACEIDEGSPVPGALYPVNVHGDATKPWVERCDECERFESDEDAARAVVAAGIGVNIGSGLPYGGLGPHPYIILRMNMDEKWGDEFYTAQ